MSKIVRTFNADKIFFFVSLQSCMEAISHCCLLAFGLLAL